MKKILALVLAVLMICPLFVACDKDPGKTPDETPEVTTDGTPQPGDVDYDERKHAKDNLPADFNMKGEKVGVLTRDSYRVIDWDGGASVDSDVLAQAVYNRTVAVENRLGLTFNVTEMPIGYNEYGASIKENILAGDDTWQIILAATNASIMLGTDHLFRDMSDNKYLDFDQPWWAKAVMENISLDGKSIRYMSGDAIMNTYYWAGVTYFNKRIYQDAFGDPDDLYKKALNYDWYYDDMIEMAEIVANDADGDGEWDVEDTYGFICDSGVPMNLMQDATGMRTFTRAENGYPVLDHDVERGSEVLDKLYKLYWEASGSLVSHVLYKQHPKGGGAYFTDGTSLFYVQTLSYTGNELFRNMKDDYGILPIPRIDEKQTEYVAPISSSATFIVVPKTCTDERIGGVLEALSSESYRNVVEVFYESALKMKYSRDAYSGQCIDIIRTVLYKDFLTEYYRSIGDTNYFPACIRSQKKTYVSTYTSQVDAVNKAIVDHIDAILAAVEE